jgi:hypothetical protein
MNSEEMKRMKEELLGKAMSIVKEECGFGRAAPLAVKNTGERIICRLKTLQA